MTPDDETPAPEVPVEVETPAPSADDRIEALEKEKKDLHDRLLRTAADFDNFRKRSRKEMDDARAKAREDVLKEMLPVIDNLERALAASEQAQSAAGIADGVKLVLRQFSAALERFEVKGFSSVGEAFDPTRHEAIAQIESAEHPAGTVVTEMQKGYLMGARLVRPALVAVARPPAKPEPEPEAASSAPAVEAEPTPAGEDEHGKGGEEAPA